MQRAISLLDARVIPVAQVARLCGYENPSNFYRVFKETFGLTPRAYVQQHGGEVLDDDEFGEVFVEPVGEEGVACRPRAGAGGDPAPDGRLRACRSQGRMCRVPPRRVPMRT